MFTIHTAKTPLEILELSDALDKFVNKWSQNPLLLRGFISQIMNSSHAKGWTPRFLTVKFDGRIVGTAPLMTRTHLGLRHAEFFPEDWLSPDFVVEERYREACVSCIFDYVFSRLNCQFAHLYLPKESPNLGIVEKTCRVKGYGFSVYNYSRHCVIPVDCSWEEYQSRKGRRRKIRQIECKLDQVAPWEVEYFEEINRETEVLANILEIERNSWKESLNNDLRNVNIEQLLMALEGSSIVSKDISDFRCSAWFLTFNQKPAAYTLAIRYKGTGFIVKTAYDKKYSKTYVGKYINHVAIRDMFKEGGIRTIDFMAAYPFMSFWTSSSMDHVGLSVWKGKIAGLVQEMSSSTPLWNIWRSLLQSSAYCRLKKALIKETYN